MTVLNAGVLLDFAIELFHDIIVHVLNLFLKLHHFWLDWEEVAFKFN